MKLVVMHDIVQLIAYCLSPISMSGSISIYSINPLKIVMSFSHHKQYKHYHLAVNSHLEGVIQFLYLLMIIPPLQYMVVSAINKVSVKHLSTYLLTGLVVVQVWLIFQPIMHSATLEPLIYAQRFKFALMGPTRLWVRSCWMEEIRRPAEEKLQKLQRGQSHFGRSHTDCKSHKESKKSQISLGVP